MRIFGRPQKHVVDKEVAIPNDDARRFAAMEQRVETLEREKEELHRSIARLRVEFADIKKRSNTFVDLTEQRIDLIYSQVVKELKYALGYGRASLTSESDVDRELARLLSAGLKVEIEPAAIDFNAVLSDQVKPGKLKSPLTIYGFRVDRSRAQELGDRIQIRSVQECSPGAAVYGPYKRMIPGEYRVTAVLETEVARSKGGRKSGEVELDIYSPRTDAVVVAKTLKADKLLSTSSISVEFRWTPQNAEDVVEIRLHQKATVPFALTEIVVEAL